MCVHTHTGGRVRSRKSTIFSAKCTSCHLTFQLFFLTSTNSAFFLSLIPFFTLTIHFPISPPLTPSHMLFIFCFTLLSFLSCRTVQRQKWTGTSAVPCVTCSSPPQLWPSPTTREKLMPRESAWFWGSHPTYPQPWPAPQTQVSSTFHCYMK